MAEPDDDRVFYDALVDRQVREIAWCAHGEPGGDQRHEQRDEQQQPDAAIHKPKDEEDQELIQRHRHYL